MQILDNLITFHFKKTALCQIFLAVLSFVIHYLL